MELIFRRKPLSDDPVSSCLLGQGGGAERGEWVEGGSGAERGEWVEGGSCSKFNFIVAKIALNGLEKNKQTK